MTSSSVEYQNPVIRGFHPDPSVIRVDEAYYLVNSTFQFWPAVVISRSYDLIHWEIIGHGVTNPDWLDLGDLADSHGVWAADISYYDQKFWIYATLRLNNPAPGELSPLRRQFVTSANEPQGPWSRPVFLDVDDIDASHFVDEDSTRYMLISPGVNIVKLSDNGVEVLSEPTQIWPGTGRRCPEGPHVFRKDGWYYAMLAEGGTGFGHCITLARSKSLYGPYEDCPTNPVLTATGTHSPIQRTGHGKFVQKPDGSWWITFLCGRPNEGEWTTIGRETALSSVTWTEEGWPIIEPPAAENEIIQPIRASWKDNFDSPSFDLRWLFVRAFDPQVISLTRRPGWLSVEASSHGLGDLSSRSLVLARETELQYSASTRVFLGMNSGSAKAGLVAYYDTRNHITLTGSTDSRGLKISLERTKDGEVEVLGTYFLVGSGGVDLRTQVRGQTRSFFARDKEGDWVLVGTIQECTFLSDEGVVTGKHHTGTLIGLCAFDPWASDQGSTAEFDWFHYET